MKNIDKAQAEAWADGHAECAPLRDFLLSRVLVSARTRALGVAAGAAVLAALEAAPGARLGVAAVHHGVAVGGVAGTGEPALATPWTVAVRTTLRTFDPRPGGLAAADTREPFDLALGIEILRNRRSALRRCHTPSSGKWLRIVYQYLCIMYTLLQK